VPLCSVLYLRGAFTVADVDATALVLAIYAAGLPAFVLQKVLQPLFYAREDTRRPFNYAVVSMLTNAGIAIGLMPVIGFAAAALATTLSAWIMLGQLWLGSRRMGDEARLDVRFGQRGPRIVAASVVMGGLLWGGAWGLDAALQTDGIRYLALAGLIAAGIVGYFVIGTAIGAFKLSDFRRALRRSKD